MKGRVIFSSFFMAIIILFLGFPLSGVQAKIADGTYDVSYEMKENSNNNTSIADGYFASPAKLTVKDGKQKIRLTVTGAQMVKSLSTPKGAVSVISDSGETRVVEFSVDGDLSNPLPMTMHIVVPKEALPPNGYDMTHTARAFFNVGGLPASEKKAESEKKETKAKEKPKKEENSEAKQGEKKQAESEGGAEKAEAQKEEKDAEEERKEEEKKEKEKLEKEKEAKRLEKEKKVKKIKEEREKREEERLRKIEEEKELEAAKLVAAEEAEKNKRNKSIWIYSILTLVVLSGAGFGIFKYLKAKK